jgi:uncharacterized membrane protein YkoI
MDRKKLFASAAAAAVLTLGIGTAVAAQQGSLPGEEDEAPGQDDATEQPITASALDRASETALAHVGGGEVTETEVGDEEGYYEVEVTRADGSQVDVHLNRGFDVLGTEGDGATEDDS